MIESAVVLNCEDDPIVGIVHEPEAAGNTGVVIIVAGGPQYRVGAHRQFVMLARRIARQGMPVIRFDHRGTGDSNGSYRGFMDMQADIACAVNFLQEKYPKLEKIALWGECESASAAAYYAHTDQRISGILMVNPWVRTEVGLAKTYLKHHYRARLADPEFWKKVRSGNFSVSQSVGSMLSMVGQLLSSKLEGLKSTGTKSADDLSKLPLTERLEQSLLRYEQNILVLTSGRDHIAQEYKDFVSSSKDLTTHLEREAVELHEIADSDHTFSRSEWREELFEKTTSWLAHLKITQ